MQKLSSTLFKKQFKYVAAAVLTIGSALSCVAQNRQTSESQNTVQYTDSRGFDKEKKYYDIPQKSLWDEKTDINLSWLSYQNLTTRIKDEGIFVDERENLLLDKIYTKSDKIKQDKVLQGEELLNFSEKLRYSSLKNNAELYNILCELVNEKKEEKDLNTTLANNLEIAMIHMKDLELIKQAVSHVNGHNIYDVAKKYYEQTKHLDFFSNLIKFGVIYSNDETHSNFVLEKVFQGFIGLLEQAKNNDIYVSDYEERILNYSQKNRLKEAGVELDNLFKRIYLAKESLENSLLKERVLELQHPNGTIDGKFAQGAVNDCWFLASLISYLHQTGGADKINDLIIYKNNPGQEKIEVLLPKASLTLNMDEVYGANEYSSGDLDVRALELGVNTLLKDVNSTLLNSSYDLSKGFELLLGDKVDNIVEGEVNSSFISLLKKSEGLAVLGTKNVSDDHVLYDEENNAVKPISSHAYAVVGIDDNYVYVINPWNSEQKLKCNVKELGNIFNKGAIAQLK